MTLSAAETSQSIAEAHSSLFDLVISPLSRDSFLSNFWGRNFLHLRGTGGRFTCLLSWEALSRALEHHRFEPARLRLIRNGNPIDSSGYLTAIGELKPVALINCLSEGATLVLNSIDGMLPAIRELAEAFQENIQSRTTVNVYAGWRTQTGLDLHWDPQDTMILQVSGRKRWLVYAPTRLHPLENDVESGPEPTSEPVWEGILEDGEVLYLPRLVAHRHPAR
jgi:hypothetical protein